MNSAELTCEILKSLNFEPTNSQAEALRKFVHFMFMRSSTAAMIMRGSAGTGKTTLASAIVRTLHRLGAKVVLMAPTGRAAKVFSLNSGMPAHTIHRRIYRQQSFAGVDTAFNIAPNMAKDTVFFVDEASMIASQSGFAEGAFGSGNLLSDLVRYVYNDRNCRLVLIGDKAQLPPVGAQESPALDATVMGGYGLDVVECDINEVLRQSEDSGILHNATMIRQMITHDEMTQLPQIRFRNFADIEVVMGDELIEQLSSSYSRVGIDDTMIIVRSNKRANIYNQGIRNMILGREELLTSGDRLMVVKNNYHPTAHPNPPERRGSLSALVSKSNYNTPILSEGQGEAPPSFLANGDVAIVQKVRGERELYGFHFADVWLRFPDYNDYELQTTVLLDSLLSDSPSLSREQQEQLFNALDEDYAHVKLKTERMKAIREDAHYNALQVKFAYAVTCHKAQGGQWEHVYLDQGYMTDEMLSPDYIHWLYTAFTRATGKLFLVNWPKEQRE